MKGITGSKGLAILLNGQILTILNPSEYGMDFIVCFGWQLLGRRYWFLSVCLAGPPGKARGFSSNTSVTHSLIHSLSHLFLPQLYGAATPKQLEIGLPVTK